MRRNFTGPDADISAGCARATTFQKLNILEYSLNTHCLIVRKFLRPKWTGAIGQCEPFANDPLVIGGRRVISISVSAFHRQGPHTIPAWP
jgi:hypothetical protein